MIAFLIVFWPLLWIFIGVCVMFVISIRHAVDEFGSSTDLTSPIYILTWPIWFLLDVFGQLDSK